MAKRIKNKLMSKKIVIILSVLFLGVLLVGGYLYADKILTKSYVAVHLTNGDTYFGQLDRFPKLQLGDVHVIQPVPDSENPGQTTLQVVPLNLIAFWGPDKLQINRDQVVFIAKIGEDSQVMQVIRRYKETPVQ
ncbi:MAG: hypothetical protein ABH880_01630 [Patescibacteria group bacterium]